MHTPSLEHATLPNSVLRRFEQERLALQLSISGLPSSTSPDHYASLLFRRLLVLSFLQAHGFLGSDPLYISHQLQATASTPNHFFQQCLLPLFQQLSSTTPNHLPALHLPLFTLQTYETSSLSIPDRTFEQLFAFFSTFHWSLSPPSPRPVDILGPDILASLFEQQLDQKQLGAYYTRADVTFYTVTNTLIPYLLNALTRHYPKLFSSEGPLLSLLQATPDGYILSALRTPSYLPLESRREFQARQARYALLLTRLQDQTLTSTADLINANIDLAQLLLDTITTTDDPTFVLTLYTLLSQTTILDPTCGSGAFLLAALSLLQPLYSACLTRMAYFLQNVQNFALSREQQTLCIQTLAALKRAPDQTFFIVEQCINNNLYGVDIMDEAVQMSQLYLYLTLLASLQRAEDLPLFSHISFHIRVGNALVGFVHPPASAAELTLEAERVRLDVLLARTHDLFPTSFSDCGVNLHFLTQWREKHRPFHWYLEFPSCMQQGGFSVLIGNPPFIEYHRTSSESLFSYYQTQRCGNLYALVIERVLTLCRPQESFLGLLLPLSLCAAQRFSPVRNLLLKQTAHLWLANFSIFPCRLFEGAFQRLSLLLAQHSTHEPCQLATTRIQRWYARERPFLLPLISYTLIPPVIHQEPSLFPKLASPLHEQILTKLFVFAQGKTLAHLLLSSPTPHFVYYQEATNYWTKASCVIPYYKKNGRVMHPSHGRFLYFSDQPTAQAVMALLNSSLFYVWFATYSDGFHLAHTLVKSFPVAPDLALRTKLPLLAQRLQDHISLHSQHTTRNTQPSSQGQRGHLIELEEFHMGRSKSLLDEIDASLACYYSFTGEELDFVVDYDGKYRIG